ncbi:methylenetetrahydrofolate reductase [Natronobacterium gregoryi]|uniref:Methylenetetrahydrofolate reductase n=2 Tax=Natronobacterium gregoryi TaxID=44930 RepID=L0AKR4_NATGS|nr:methylenetetrahydrofolate reductase [Natronobacterium gregoryi]AFZ74044.1 5,10-methylenetetrahydrofolate reductase [Natronobacterium gregoryi SP2]ELY70388.1 5,10-methylenetetrahydrofolate reductase [Natronobacterium gregoryi SP2]PLK20790.1 methylenetetrahydrofolate reductase [Natronobacterium gregoryi SP2]SFJ06920.1 methylenetetrahydrofolate reductase (NADPH) [Natronobacterium gregoryi]
MSSEIRTGEVADGIVTLLEEPRFELMPFDSMDDQLEHLPDGAEIAITTSPTLGLEATIDWTERATDRGFEVVPHVAARYVRDEDHLAEIAGRLTDAGVTDVFVPGGDREEPIGEFTSAYDLLSTLEDLAYEFEGIGITGYPEGHDFLDDEVLAEAMAKKEPYATYIVTQLCYDPQTILEWIEEIRGRGVDLPVEVGIPGVMKYQRLLQISRKVGVGDSIRFLQKTSGVLGFLKELVGSRGTYVPDELVAGLAPYATDSYYDVCGVHVYAFNQVPDLESWRSETLTQYG